MNRIYILLVSRITIRTIEWKMTHWKEKKNRIPNRDWFNLHKVRSICFFLSFSSFEFLLIFFQAIFKFQKHLSFQLLLILFYRNSIWIWILCIITIHFYKMSFSQNTNCKIIQNVGEMVDRNGMKLRNILYEEINLWVECFFFFCWCCQHNTEEKHWVNYFFSV